MKHKATFILLIAFASFSCAKAGNQSSSENHSSIEINDSKTETITSALSNDNESILSSVESIDKSSSVQSYIDAAELKLTNNNGMSVTFDRKGARIQSITMDGKTIGQNGFIAGRVANRIANGSFELDGITYELNKNEGRNTLHGGSKGFGEIQWNVTSLDEKSVTFVLNSPDGDMGFPGNMTVTTKYALDDEGELSFEINAISDKKTLFNPINHLYMNLNGSTSVSNHTLWIDGDKYLSTDSSKLPNGTIKDVSERPSIDYRTKKTYQSGNDRCLVLNGEGYRKVAELTGNTTGYKTELYTDRPALQLYDDGKNICLEAQDYIDAIHHPEFPSIVLEANEEWHSKSAYRFNKR